MIDLTFGKGTFQESTNTFKGRIILSEHKLFLKNESGEEITQTYVPLEKIEAVQGAGIKLLFYVRLSLTYRYELTVSGEKREMKALVEEIVRRRGFKKLFMKNKWVEDS